MAVPYLYPKVPCLRINGDSSLITLMNELQPQRKCKNEQTPNYRRHRGLGGHRYEPVPLPQFYPLTQNNWSPQILTCIKHCVRNFLITVLNLSVFHLAFTHGTWNMGCASQHLSSFLQLSVVCAAENPELCLLTCQYHPTKRFLHRCLGEISSEWKIAIMFVSG